uniref:Uncharacterized protein n=1 Tax=Globisporangium ultimum (strain ATCC 200006 / CBS 805.95 / DAOM BR144) TaxID=431595 RepID=K3WE62_GLOUD
MTRENDSFVMLASLKADTMSSMDAITGGSMHSSRTYRHLSSKTLVLLDDPVAAAAVTKLLVPDGGPEMLFSDLGRRLRTALDRPLPQLEVSFRNLSISVDVPVMNDNDGNAQRPSASPSAAFELPTLVNVVKNGVRSAFTKPRVEKKYILNNISGMLKPGTMALVLG